MKIELTPCFILHTRDYLESSLLLDIFSREHGRLSLIAKGGRRQKSRFAGLLQPYHQLHIACSGRSELKTLTDVEAISSPYELTEEKSIIGFYANELLTKLLHRHEAHPQLFDLYDHAIRALARSEEVNAVLRIFEKGLLKSLGYGLVLDHDVDNGQAIEAHQQYYYLLDKGPLKTRPHNGDYVGISGKSLLALARENFLDEHELDEAKRLMRLVLSSHLGDRVLSSKVLYQAYLDRAKMDRS